MTAIRGATRQIATFGAIGVASTLAYIALYAGLRSVSPAAAANALALVVTAVANTAANRRFTFEVQGRAGLARDHAAGLLALAAALIITSVALAGLDFIAPRHGRLTEIAVLVAANAAATFVRFLVLRSALIDRARSARMSPARTLATLSTPERTRG
jgi:putative flippase GtrA